MRFNNSFKNKVTYSLTNDMYKQDLALNNPQRLICHKIPTNLTIGI